jgi:HD-GYP domain-containing protein (c-di-GMP phosphodiesterase class II)
MSHHERYDGRGYPRGIKGENIPIEGRILCIVDAFDAMTTDRPYRKALSIEEALEELRRNRGIQFDPYLTDIFIKLFEDNKLAVS